MALMTIRRGTKGIVFSCDVQLQLQHQLEAMAELTPPAAGAEQRQLQPQAA